MMFHMDTDQARDSVCVAGAVVGEVRGSDCSAHCK